MCKRKPIRRCSGCGERFEKNELIRVVRIANTGIEENEHRVAVDFIGKIPGRGVYICKKSKCLKKVIKSNRFSKMLHCPIPKEIFDELERSIQKIEG